MNTRTAALNFSMSNAPYARLNFIRFSDARLQAVLSRKRYSEQGFVEFWRPVPLHVCHLWMVESNCIPGSPQICVPSAIFRNRLRSSFCSHCSPLTTLRVLHSLPSIAAFLNSSLTPSSIFSFCYIFMLYNSTHTLTPTSSSVNPIASHY